MVAYFVSIVVTVPLKKGVLPAHHAIGFTAMIEKKPDTTALTKLRTILLMEAAFNKYLAEIFGCCMMDPVRNNRLMQEEIFSEHRRTSANSALEKGLIYAIPRQGQITIGLASIDAANCHGSTLHVIGSLICQSLGIRVEALESMLFAIQDMKFFLQTAYGNFKHCMGRTVKVKFQGYC